MPLHRCLCPEPCDCARVTFTARCRHRFCPKIITGLDTIKVQCAFFAYKVVVLFLGANDLKLANCASLSGSRFGRGAEGCSSTYSQQQQRQPQQRQQQQQHFHDPAADLRLVLETIASECPRTVGVVIVDPLPFVRGLFYTQSASLWDLTPAPRRSLSEEYAFLVAQVVESEAVRLSPRLSVRHVRMADLALTDNCLDGVHYTGTHPNGTRTITASTVARAILAEGHAVLPVSR